VGLCQGRLTALRTLVVTFDTAHSSGWHTVRLKGLAFLFIRHHKLWNDVYFRTAIVTASAGTLLQKQLSSHVKV